MLSKNLPIHTLNARGNIMLEVMRDYFNITPDRMLIEIQGMRKEVAAVLKLKGVNYDELRAALVPNPERLEIALIFDWTKIESNWYGNEVFKRLIPLLDPKTKNSILHGDYIGSNNNQDILYQAFYDEVCPVRPIIYEHSTQFYIVYINNLTDTAFQKLADDLINFEGYVGCANTTYSSNFKTLLSMKLSSLCVKFGRKIIQGHEDDRDDAENVNMCGYPFEENGYDCVSIRSNLEGVFLSYKIERPILDGFEVDTDFSVNAVNSNIADLRDLNILVEDAKLEYIKKAKSGSLHYAGLSEISAEELQEIIRCKISSNYIYNMSHLEDYNVTKFSIVIEVLDENSEPFRLMAALEYRPGNKELRLLTLY